MEQMVSQEHFKINVAARMGIEPGAMAIQGGWYTRCSTRGAAFVFSHLKDISMVSVKRIESSRVVWSDVSSPTPCDVFSHTPCDVSSHTPCDVSSHTPCDVSSHTPCTV
jgi:hypothetical protein